MIGVVLITHGQLGQQLVDTVTGMLGGLSLATEVVAVHRHDDPDERAEQAAAAMARLGDCSELLLLTDAFGSTPSNIANRLAGPGRQVVAGVNLPMLVRIYNYPDLELGRMVESAVEAGRNGIMPCGDTSGDNARG